MAKDSPAGERRAADRPANGDTRRCPDCGALTLEFSERYRIAPQTGSVIAAPAWICDSARCKHLRFARAADNAPKGAARLRAVSKDLRDMAARRLMKSRHKKH